MVKYLNKILIIDGSYMLHRSLKTPGLEELATSSGVKSGGVFGFLRIFQSEIKRFSGYFPVVCWDKGLSQRRIDLYPDYKANRERQASDELIALGLAEKNEYLEEYHRQRADVIAILKSFGVPSLIIPGWEGDDLQYLISKVCEDCVLISDDKDMIQLVSPTCRIRRSMRDELITWDDSDEYYHHPRFTIRKAIVGDGSDNIPKVAKGLGDKGADQIADMIKSLPFDKYKSFLEKYVEESSDKLTKKVQSLLDNWDQFVINYKLMDLRLVEPPEGFESMIKDLITLTIGRPKLMEAYSLLGKYEMNTIYPDQIIATISASSVYALKEK